MTATGSGVLHVAGELLGDAVEPLCDGVCRGADHVGDLDVGEFLLYSQAEYLPVLGGEPVDRGEQFLVFGSAQHNDLR